MTLLDGAMGTELEARGIDTSGPAWSARALFTAPEEVAELHRAYARAGATVHTANTFRTTPRAFGPGWEAALRRAIAAAREAGGVVAGSVAPLEDCWHPERSPADPRPEHRAIARELARAGADLALVETFCHAGEVVVAVESALEAGLVPWVALTAGPDLSLATPAELARLARRVAAAGAARVLVNCVPARSTLPYLLAVAEAGLPFGAYANAGLGAARTSPEEYAEHAATWVAAGATTIGGCCGAGPAHIRALPR